MQREETRTHDVFHVGPMEGLIEIEDPREFAALRLRGELAIDLAQSRDDLLATIIGKRRSGVCRESLEVADNENDLTPIILRERRDDEALILAAAHRRNESFLLQSMECAAHGRATEPQTLGHGTLGDAGAGWEVAPDDQTAQFLIDAGDRIGPRVGIRRRCTRGRRRRR